MYLIMRDDGALVADMRKSRTGSSYTHDIRQAMLYQTRESAERNTCPGNERVVSMDSYVRGEQSNTRKAETEVEE